ncbi:MAG TPA: anaerobic glycerol-3-phosphate dehydrogenase subunit C [Smithellaceae bacterium]|nr:anaerobic glycerol-3-phosphate dehydrogenase subunit C [Smithellaceae bacterium]
MNFEHCMRCTICVENCPVFRVNPAFPGPKQAGPDAQRFRSKREKAVDEWVLLCSQCKRCEMSCPSGVEPAQIILEAQQRFGAEHPHTPAHLLFANNYYLSALGSLTAPVANRVAATATGRKIFNAFGIATSIPFPPFRFRKLSREKKTRSRSGRKVAFFYGCFINFYRPDIGRKIIRLLQYFGIDVVLPPQWCCGLPALGNGNLSLARSFALKNAASLSNYVDAGYDILYSCTSCGLCLLHDYQRILDVPQAKKIAERTFDLHEYLLRLINDGDIEPAFTEVRRALAYHIPCHLRALKIGYPAVKLLERIPGLSCAVLDDSCCGLSGSYGFKKSNEATAMELGRRAVYRISKTGAEAIVADCGSCRMQLGALSELEAFDPVEILCESLNICAPKTG